MTSKPRSPMASTMALRRVHLAFVAIALNTAAMEWKPAGELNQQDIPPAWYTSNGPQSVQPTVVAEAVPARLIGEELATALIHRLGLETSPVVKVSPMPVRLSAKLRASFSMRSQGTLRRLFAQSKLLECLCRLSAQVITPDLTPPTPVPAGSTPELHDDPTQLESSLHRELRQ